VILEALRPAAGGCSVALHDGIVHFVRGALPGETVEAEVTESRKSHRFANATRILEPSPHRVPPPCPVYGICGGCRLQHAAYPAQLEMKRDVLRDTLRRIGRIEPGDIDANPSEPYGYRVRGTFRVDARGPALLREASHDLVHVDRCPLMSEGINRVLPALQGLPAPRGIDEVRIVSNGEKTSIAFRDRRGDDETRARLASAGIAGGSFADGAWGEPRVAFPLGGLEYAVSPAAFLQANWRVNLALVERLAGLCGETGGRVLDLYAGAGNFALPIAAAGCAVVAVEGHDDSFRSLQENIAGNGLSGRCRAVRSPVERFRDAGRFDLLLLDPPRTGLSPAARALVLKIGAPRIAFVSCDPATLARDLSALSPRYGIRSVSMYDFFPQTHHIETLALLDAR
jgi:23S rRNA (uracil1939-C5)-methyltransferase